MIFSTWAGRVSVRTQRHRLDDAGRALRHDRRSRADRRRSTTRAEIVAARLTAAVERWRQEMFGDAAERTRDRRRRNAVDPRPIPVGYREFPITMLPARDGEPRGGVRRSSGARTARTS